MDKYIINITSHFSEELENIYYYIYFYLNSPKAANRLYNKVKNEILSLRNSPERYSKVYDIRDIKNDNIRKLLVSNYIIIYQVDNIKKQVFILHIFHGSQNYFNKI